MTLEERLEEIFESHGQSLGRYKRSARSVVWQALENVHNGIITPNGARQLIVKMFERDRPPPELVTEIQGLVDVVEKLK